MKLSEISKFIKTLLQKINKDFLCNKNIYEKLRMLVIIDKLQNVVDVFENNYDIANKNNLGLITDIFETYSDNLTFPISQIFTEIRLHLEILKLESKRENDHDDDDDDWRIKNILKSDVVLQFLWIQKNNSFPKIYLRDLETWDLNRLIFTSENKSHTDIIQEFLENCGLRTSNELVEILTLPYDLDSNTKVEIINNYFITKNNFMFHEIFTIITKSNIRKLKIEQLCEGIKFAFKKLKNKINYDNLFELLNCDDTNQFIFLIDESICDIENEKESNLKNLLDLIKIKNVMYCFLEHILCKKLNIKSPKYIHVLKNIKHQEIENIKKLSLVGPKSSGKTAVFNRFFKNKFKININKTWCAKKFYDTENNEIIKVEMYDSRNYLKISNFAITLLLCCDLSIDFLEPQQIDKNTVIIGTKADIAKNETIQRLQTFSINHKINFILTSAKQGIDINMFLFAIYGN